MMNSEFGIDFGQKVDLTASIRNILRNYPEGTAILKELVQNADDAGARTVSFCLDYRTHPVDNLASQSLAPFQGPSLLIYNDAIFTETDFQSIQRIGDSLKKTEDTKAKIGRFGIGFNAVYHWTDLPSFVSNKYLVMLDPQAKYLPNVNPSNPGKIIDFIRNPDILRQYSDQFAPYLYNNNNFKKPFDGTLFRLPLRTSTQAETSLLSKRALSVNDAKALFASLQLEASAMLLFLKNIEKITIQEWHEGDVAPSILFSCEVFNSSADIRQKRNMISNQAMMAKSHQNIVTADYMLNISCQQSSEQCSERSCGGGRSVVTYTEVWEVSNQLGGIEANRIANNPDNALLRLIPWGGVAACVHSSAVLSSSTSGESHTVRSGLAYCFLPLPVQTGLPVMCNGFFELSSNRRDVWQAGIDMTGDGQTRAQWNIALMRDIIAPSYARLLAKCCASLGFTSEYQNLWPSFAKVNNAPWNEVVRGTLLLCRDKKLLCVTRTLPTIDATGRLSLSNVAPQSTSSMWIEPCNALLLPNSNSSASTINLAGSEQLELSAFLIRANTNIVLCCDSLRDTLIDSSTSVNIATPARVRSILQSRGSSGGYRVDVDMCRFLLHYCFSDLKPNNTVTNARELNNLHFLPLHSHATSTLAMYTDAQIGSMAELTGMGFSLISSIRALKKSNYDVMAALEAMTTTSGSAISNNSSSSNTGELHNELLILADEEESRIFRAAAHILVDKAQIGAMELEFLTHSNMLKYSNLRQFGPNYIPDLLRFILPTECFAGNEYRIVGSGSTDNKKNESLVAFVKEFWRYVTSQSNSNTAILQSVLNNVCIVPNANFTALFCINRLSNLVVTAKGDSALQTPVVDILTTLGVNIVDPSILSSAAASRLPKLFYEYVHVPNRSGVLAAIDFALREQTKKKTISSDGLPTNMLTSAQRDELRTFLAASEPVKQLSEMECGVIRQLPIFTNFKQLRVAATDSATVFQYVAIGSRTSKLSAPSPYFTLGDCRNISSVLFPENALRHSNPSELVLLEHIGVKIMRRSEFFRKEFLPHIGEHYASHQLDAESTVTDMLMELKALVAEDKDFLSFLRNTAFIPCGDGLENLSGSNNNRAAKDSSSNTKPSLKLCRVSELFDPTVSELLSLLDSRFFPTSAFQSAETLAVLRSQLNLQTTIEWSGVIACARAVQDIPDTNEYVVMKQSRGSSLLNFLDKNIARLMIEETANSNKNDSGGSSGKSNKSSNSFSLFSFTISLFGASNVVESRAESAVEELQQAVLSVVEYVKQLQAIAWVPVCLTSPHPLLPWRAGATAGTDKLLPCATPLEATLPADMWWCSYSRRIVLVSVADHTSAVGANNQLCKVLGWDSSAAIDSVIVAVQLREISSRHSRLFAEEKIESDQLALLTDNVTATSSVKSQLIELHSIITATVPQIYSRLNSAPASDHYTIAQVLKSSAWLWVGDKFVNIEKVALMVAVNAVPYLYALPQEYSAVYTRLMSVVFKIKSQFSAADYVAVLTQMAIDTNAATTHPSSNNSIVKNADVHKISALSASLLNIAISLATLLNSSGSAHDESTGGTVTNKILFENSTIYIPDANNKLAPSTDLVNDDVPWLSGNEYISIRLGCRFVHSSISSSVAEKLGVQSLRRVLINKNIEHNLFSSIAGGSSGVSGGTIESFGQAESLTNRLKTILDMYPDGFPIFSELIQNADDAGATKVCILLDDSQYGTESLLDPKMAALQGPSLVVFNDAMFSESDYRNLASIGQGSKLDKLATTGRFGLGFNSTYHLTDTPSIVSGDYLVIFDPHCSHVPGATNNQPGIRIKFNSGEKGSAAGREKNSLVSTFKHQFEPFQYFNCTFEEAFRGTLFRFPLRTAALARQSAISKRSYTVPDLESNLSQLISQLPNLLLFLRNVKTVEIYRNIVSSDSALHKPVLLHRATASHYDVVTKNDQSLLTYFDKNKTPIQSITAPGNVFAVAPRDTFYNRLQNTPENALPELTSKIHIVVESYGHEPLGTESTSELSLGTTSDNAQQKVSVSGDKADLVTTSHSEIDYIVVSGLCGGEARRLACDNQLRHFKLVPMGSVAACISRSYSGGDSLAATDVNSSSSLALPTEFYPGVPGGGLAYCFLPLPVHTQLPVHINAYWELSSNRRDIWRGDDTKGEAKLRSDWNVQVMKDVVAPLYAKLLLAVHKSTSSLSNQNQGDINKIRNNSNIILSLLPSPMPQKPWDVVASALFPLIRGEALLFSRLNGGCFVSPNKAFLLKDSVSDTELSVSAVSDQGRLETLLLLEMLPIVVVTKDTVLRTLLDSNIVCGQVNPFLVRSHYNKKNHLVRTSGQQKHPSISLNNVVKSSGEVVSNAAFLLNYCFSDLKTPVAVSSSGNYSSQGNPFNSLKGVCLLPLENNTLGTLNDSTDEHQYFLVNDLERKILAAGAGGSLIAPESVIGSTVYNMLKSSHFSNHTYNISTIDVVNMLKLICGILPKQWLAMSTSVVSVSPQDTNSVSSEWLASLWQYIIDNKAIDMFTDVIPLLPVIANEEKEEGEVGQNAEKNEKCMHLVKISSKVPVLHMSFESLPSAVISGLSNLQIYVFEASLLGNVSYSSDIVKLLSAPTAQGFLAALHTADSRIKATKASPPYPQWSGETRAALHSYVLDNVVAKIDTLSSDDVTLLCSLPIWVVHTRQVSSAAPSTGVGESDTAVCAQSRFCSLETNTVHLSPTNCNLTQLLNESYVRMRHDRDRALYLKLGLGESLRGTFFGSYVIPLISGGQITDSAVVDSIVVEIVRNISQLEAEHPGITAAVTTLPLIRTNSGQLGVLTSLYDPDSPFMSTLLPASMFPSSQLYADAPSVLVALRSLGLNTALHCEGVVAAAMAIQSEYMTIVNNSSNSVSSTNTPSSSEKLNQSVSIKNMGTDASSGTDNSALDAVVLRATGLFNYLHANIERLLSEADSAGLMKFNEEQRVQDDNDESTEGMATRSALSLGAQWAQSLRSIAFIPVFLSPPSHVIGGLPWPSRSHLSPLATPSQSIHIDQVWFSSSSCRICSVPLAHSTSSGLMSSSGQKNKDATKTALLLTMLGWNKPLSGRNLTLQLINIKNEYDQLFKNPNVNTAVVNTVVAAKIAESYAIIIPQLFAHLFAAYKRETSQEIDLWLRALQQKPVLYLKGNRFVEPGRVAFRPLSFDTEPFLFSVPEELKPFGELLTRLGVKERFEAADLAQLTRDIYSDNNNNSNGSNALSSQKFNLVLGVVKVLFGLVNGEISSAATESGSGDTAAAENTNNLPATKPVPIDVASLGTIFLPDTHKVLVAAHLLTFDDAPWISSALRNNNATSSHTASAIRFVTESIDNKIALKLGCRSLREQLFNGDEILCPNAQRLKELLDGDEGDTVSDTISDLVSLADTLKCASTSFVFDPRTHDSVSLIHPGLRAAQGPALVSFMDGPVLNTEEVLKLLTLPTFENTAFYQGSVLTGGDVGPIIGNHGEGGTSRFRPSMGKRLFSAFTITDCLQIVTGNELYIFDPSGQYLMSGDLSAEEAASLDSSIAAPKINKLSKHHSTKGEKVSSSAKAQHYCFTNRDKGAISAVQGASRGKDSTIYNVLTRFPDQFSGFTALSPVVDVLSLITSNRPIQGVLIRMPLRTRRSELSKTITSGTDVRVAYGGMKSHLSGALVFAKSLVNVGLYHVEHREFVEVELNGTDKAVEDTPQAATKPSPSAVLDLQVRVLPQYIAHRQTRHSLLQDKGWQTRGLTKLFTKSYVPGECNYALQLAVTIPLNTSREENDQCSTWLVPNIQLSSVLENSEERTDNSIARTAAQVVVTEDWLLYSINGHSKLRDLCVNEPYIGIKQLNPFVTIAVQYLSLSQLAALSVAPDCGCLFNHSSVVNNTGLPFHIEGSFLQLSSFSDEMSALNSGASSAGDASKRRSSALLKTQNTAASVPQGTSLFNTSDITVVQQWNEALIFTALDQLYPKSLTEIRNKLEFNVLSSSTQMTTVLRSVALSQSAIENAKGFYKYFIYRKRVSAHILKIIHLTNVVPTLVTSQPVFLSRFGFKTITESQLPIKVFAAPLNLFLETNIASGVVCCPVQLTKDLDDFNVRGKATLSPARLRNLLKTNVLFYINKLITTNCNGAGGPSSGGTGSTISALNIVTLVLPLLAFALSDINPADGEFLVKKLYKELCGVPLLLLANNTIRIFPLTRDSMVAVSPVIFHLLLPQLADVFVHPRCYLLPENTPNSNATNSADAIGNAELVPYFTQNVMFMESVFVSPFHSGFIHDKISAILPSSWRAVQAVQYGVVAGTNTQFTLRSIGRTIATAVGAGGEGQSNTTNSRLTSEVQAPSELLIYCLWNKVLALESWASLSRLHDTPLVPVVSQQRRLLLSTSLLLFVFCDSGVATTSAEDANRNHLKREAGRVESLAMSSLVVSGSPIANAAEDPWKWTTESCEKKAELSPAAGKQLTALQLADKSCKINAQDEPSRGVNAVSASASPQQDQQRRLRPSNRYTTRDSFGSSSGSDGDDVIVDSDDEAFLSPVPASSTPVNVNEVDLQMPGSNATAASAVTGPAPPLPPATDNSGRNVATSVLVMNAMVALGVPFLDLNLLESTPVALVSTSETPLGKRLLECLHTLASLNIMVYQSSSIAGTTATASTSIGTEIAGDLAEGTPLLNFQGLSITERNTLLSEMYSAHRPPSNGPNPPVAVLTAAELDKFKQVPLFTNSKDTRAVSIAECKGGVYWCTDDSVLEDIMTLNQNNVNSNSVHGSGNSINNGSDSSSTMASALTTSEPPVILVYNASLKDIYASLGIEELTPSTAVRKFIIPSLLTAGVSAQSKLDIMISLSRKWDAYKGDAALVAILKEVNFMPMWEMNSPSEAYHSDSHPSANELRKAKELFNWSNADLFDALQGGRDALLAPIYYPPPYLRNTDMLNMCVDLGLISELTEESFLTVVTRLQEHALRLSAHSANKSDVDDAQRELSERGRRLLRYILSGERILTLFQNNNYTRKIGKIKFVPIKVPVAVKEGGYVLFNDGIGSFDMMLAKQQGALAFTVLPILEDDITPPQFYFSHLGVTSSPSLEVVLRHIRHLTIHSDALVDRWNTPKYSVQQTFNALFTYLAEHWRSISVPVQDTLTQLPLIPIGHSLIKPSRLFFKLGANQDLSPFMYEIPRFFGAHEAFLKNCLRVKETPSMSDYVHFLRDLAQESNQNALNPNELRAVLAILSTIAELVQADGNALGALGTVHVPDESSIMRHSRSCIANDNNWMRNKIRDKLRSAGCYFLHPSVSQGVAAGLGVASLSELCVEKMSPSCDFVENSEELQRIYTDAINSLVFTDALSALLRSSSAVNSDKAASLDWKSKLEAVKLHFVTRIDTSLTLKLPSNSESIHLVSDGGDGSGGTISFVNKADHSEAFDLFVNPSAIHSPVTVEIAICSGVCQILAIDATLATALACMLSAAVSASSDQSGESSGTQKLMQVLRIGSDRSSSQELLRGLPGEKVTVEDYKLLELRPFRIFQIGEVIAFDSSSSGNAVESEHEKLDDTATSVPTKEGLVCYGRIVSVGDSSNSSTSSDTGIRLLTIKVAANQVATKLSTEVYSFKSAREVNGAFAATSKTTSSSGINSANNSYVGKTAATIHNTSSSSGNSNSSVSESETASVNRAISQTEVLGVVNSLLSRAGIPVSLEQHALMSKIMDLESSVKRSELELQSEREHLVQAKDSLESAAAAFKCQICLTDDISHVLVPCGHTFCETCVNQLQRNKCAMCRANIERKIKFFVAEKS